MQRGERVEHGATPPLILAPFCPRPPSLRRSRSRGSPLLGRFEASPPQLTVPVRSYLLSITCDALSCQLYSSYSHRCHSRGLLPSPWVAVRRLRLSHATLSVCHHKYGLQGGGPILLPTGHYCCLSYQRRARLERIQSGCVLTHMKRLRT